MPRCPGCSVSGRSSVTLQSVSSGHSVSVSFSACRKGPRLCDWSRWCLRFSSPLVYRARPFYLCLVRHSQDFLCPVSSVANVESNEIPRLFVLSPSIRRQNEQTKWPYPASIRIALFCNIYNGTIFPSLNPAKIFRFISR